MAIMTLLHAHQKRKHQKRKHVLAAQAVFVFLCVLVADPYAPNQAASPAPLPTAAQPTATNQSCPEEYPWAHRPQRDYCCQMLDPGYDADAGDLPAWRRGDTCPGGRYTKCIAPPCADHHRCALEPCGPRGGGGACRSHFAAFCDVITGVCVPYPSMASAGSGRDSGLDGCFHPTWKHLAGLSLYLAARPDHDGLHIQEECVLAADSGRQRQRPTERSTHPHERAQQQTRNQTSLVLWEGNYTEWRGSPFDFGCGPRFGHRVCPSAAEPYCNEGNGYCGNTTEHRDAQPGNTYDHRGGAGFLGAAWLRATSSHWWVGGAWTCYVAACASAIPALSNLDWHGACGPSECRGGVYHKSRHVPVVGPVVTLLVAWCGWRNRLGDCHPFGSTLALRPEHAGQLWRLWSYAAVHGDADHEAANLVMWAVVQCLPELAHGPWVAALVVLVVAPQAGIWNLLLRPSNNLVGLSGVVYGMLGFAAAPAVAAWRALPTDPLGQHVKPGFVGWSLVAAAVPVCFYISESLFITPRSAERVTASWQSHLGGYVAGLAMAVLVCGPWATGGAGPGGAAALLPGPRGRARACPTCRQAVVSFWRRARPVDKLAAAVLLAPPLLLAARGMSHAF